MVLWKSERVKVKQVACSLSLIGLVGALFPHVITLNQHRIRGPSAWGCMLVILGNIVHQGYTWQMDAPLGYLDAQTPNHKLHKVINSQKHPTLLTWLLSTGFSQLPWPFPMSLPGLHAIRILVVLASLSKYKMAVDSHSACTLDIALLQNLGWSILGCSATLH